MDSRHGLRVRRGNLPHVAGVYAGMRLFSVVLLGTALLIVTPLPGQQSPPKTLHLREGLVDVNRLTYVAPEYPGAARAAGIQGDVTLSIVIDTEGHVVEVTPESGPEELYDSAAEAVKQWKYRSIILNGQRIRVATTVTIHFPPRL